RLPEYVSWIASRVRRWGEPGYNPDLHFDFHASIGRRLGNGENKVLDYLAGICERAGSDTIVYFEDPMLSRSAQEARERMLSLRGKLQVRLPNARLIADEWANGPGQVAAFAQS